MKALSYVERSQMLNANPVVVAKHFQHRIETFFSKVLLGNSNPIGKISYYALCIEFLMRGFPRLHALIWTSDCPDEMTKHDYVEYINKHVQAFLPSQTDDPELHELVKTYQKHNHSKSCRKYKNINCHFNFGQFNFGQFFSKQSIVAEPLDNNMNEELRNRVLARRKEVLSLVKQKHRQSLESFEG